MRHRLAIGALSLAIAVPAAAAPWPAGKGRGAVTVTFNSLQTSRLATPAGDDVDIPDYDLREVVVTGGWGLDDRVTLLASFPLYRFSAIDGFDDANGSGDVAAGLQMQLGRVGQWVMAVRGSVQAPTGDPEKGSGLLPTGSGVWEGEGIFSIGRTFAPGRIYVFGEIGHRVRGGDLRDSVALNGEFGVLPTSRIRLAWSVRTERPYELEPGAGSIASPSGLGDGVAYTATGPGCSVRLGRGLTWSLDANSSFKARNMATGVRLRTGLTYSR